MPGTLGNQTIRSMQSIHNRLVLMTGTPIQNKTDDLVAYLNMVAPDKFPGNLKIIENYQLQERGQEEDKNMFAQLPVTKLRFLREDIAHYMERRLSRWVLRLRRMFDTIVWVNLDTNERILYNKMLKSQAEMVEKEEQKQIKDQSKK